MGGRDRHEAVAAVLLDRLLPGAHQRIVRARERNPVHHHQLAVRARHIDALPQRQRAEQAGRRRPRRRSGSARRASPRPGAGSACPAARAAPRPRPGRARIDEKRPSVRPPAASISSASSSSMSSRLPSRPGLGEVPGDVEDALLRGSRRASRRRVPFHGGTSSPSVPSGARPSEAATPLKSPPSLRVAEVRTTERSVKSFSRSSPETDSGATRSEAPKRSWRSHQTTSYSEPLAMRSATSWTFSTEASACLRTASSSWTDLSRVSPERGDHLAAGVPQRHQRVAQVLRDLLQAAGQRQLHEPLEALGRRLSRASAAFSLTSLAARAHGAVDAAGGELAGGDAGDPGDQLMGLVDDQHLVARAAPARPRSRRWRAARGW